MKRVASIAEIPGYLAALEQSSTLRDTAFLVARERVGRFVVNPLTLRAYGELRLAGNPLLHPTAPVSATALLEFLWRNSPQFIRHDARAAARFAKANAFLAVPPLPWWKTKRALARWQRRFAAAAQAHAQHVAAAREYVARALIDSPRPGANTSGEPEPYCDLAAIVARLARAYGWSEDAILDLPLRRIFQYLRECKIADYRADRRGGLQVEHPIFFGAADHIVGDYLAAINQPDRN